MIGARTIGVLLLFNAVFATNCWAVEVSSVAGLQTAVNTANSGGDRQIVISPGTYLLDGVYLRLTADSITIAGKTGKRADVVLDGRYITTEIFQVLGSNITIKDLTLKRAYYHPIHVFPDDHDVTGTVIDNVHIIDPGQQAVKINQNGAKTHSANNGRVTGSRIELTDQGRIKVWEINGSCYTGGVDGHHAANWRIRGNVIAGFWCPSGLSEHGIHFWSASSGTLVEGNTIINCDRGIGFGLGSSSHTGGIIRNNMISHDSGHAYSDVGIGLESAAGARVYNNTIFHEHAYPNAVEYRFAATSGGIISNNLTNRAISSRNDGSATLSHNITTARAGWFVAPSAGDLHLASAVAPVVDRGIFVSGLDVDFDNETRPMGGGCDIGADEWTGSLTPAGKGLPWLLLLR